LEVNSTIEKRPFLGPQFYEGVIFCIWLLMEACVAGSYSLICFGQEILVQNKAVMFN
jgi:hypothetical protein